MECDFASEVKASAPMAVQWHIISECTLDNKVRPRRSSTAFLMQGTYCEAPLNKHSNLREGKILIPQLYNGKGRICRRMKMHVA